MPEITPNCILSPTTESTLFERAVRILEIDSNRENAIVTNFSINSSKPWVVSIADINLEINSGHCAVTIAEPPEFLIREEHKISAKEKAAREKRWRLIKDLVENFSIFELITNENFGKLILTQAQKHEIDRRQIYRNLFRYWSLGQIKNALLNNVTSIGKSTNRILKKPQGRPGKYRGIVVENPAKIIDEYDRIAIRLAYGKFASGSFGKISTAHDWMCDTFYFKAGVDGQKLEPPMGSYPTAGQLKWHGKKLFDEIYHLKGRKGKVRYDKDYRPLIGEADQGLQGICHRYEIDATVADIYLVHRMNRNWLIGRPVLYVVVDSFSRMIVGIHVGLEGPSWNGARHALYNAFTTKKEFCARYNVSIEEDDWPCHYIPAEVSADRAEMLSNAASAMANTLGIGLKIAPPYRPDWKAIVESRFRLINEGLDLKFQPGGVDARKQERGDRKYELDAIFDIDQFTEMVIHAVLAHNKHLEVPHILTSQMIASEIEPNPICIWNWSKENGVMHAKRFSETELKISLLPSEEVPIRRGGIYFKKLLYNCDAIRKLNLAVKSHSERTQYIRVWYDPNCIDNAWILANNRFHALELMPSKATKYSGYRTEEIEDILATLQQVSPIKKHRKTMDGAKLQSRMNELKTDAETKLAGSPPAVSKKALTSNIISNRASELAQEQNRDILENSTIHLQNTQTQAPDNSKANQQTPKSRRGESFLKLVTDNTNQGD